jgi:uncharacterized membrane protein YfcA
MLQFVGLLLIGLFAGVASGFLGIGGGVILVPALVVALGFSQHLAQGTSLATLVLPVGVFAAWNYYRSGHVNLIAAVLLAAGFAVGGLLGSYWALELPDKALKRVFAALMLALALKMLFSD